MFITTNTTEHAAEELELVSVVQGAPGKTLMGGTQSVGLSMRNIKGVKQ